MTELIVGKTANDVWKKATEMLLNQKSTLKGRTGEIYELLHMLIKIEEPSQKWVYGRIPPLSIGFALAELVWIMNGEDRADIINAWNSNLDRFSGKSTSYHGAYGKRIRSHFGFDQIEKSYQALQNVPESRQVIIQIYDTEVDFPVNKGLPRDEDIPCNVCSMLKVRDGKLEWSQIMRSNDVLLGMPYNFVQFTGLQEILAGWLEIEVGSYNHFSDSLHLYKRDVSKIKIGQEMKMENSDSIALRKNESERVFKEIYERMKILAMNKVTDKELYSLAQLKSEYEAYNNIMFVIAAYKAHKLHLYDLTNELVEKCTNKIYIEMWHRWVNK